MNAASPTAAPPPAIDMRGVEVGAFRDLSVGVIHDVNWQVAPGDYWVVAGLQGTGKTDLLMMAAGLTPPQRGDYRLFGETMPVYEEEQLPVRLRLGLVFDGGQLFHQLTLRENLALPLRYHHNLSADAAAGQVQAFLNVMELAPWADRLPSAIGRNWVRRAGLARALMLRPEILLIDNPLGGLDPQHAAWWLNYLDQLALGHPLLDHRPVTLVVTTADFRPWKGRARQFAILRREHFRVLGDWSQVETAGGDWVADLLAGENQGD